MNGHANEEGDTGLMLLPQLFFSLPEDTLTPFVLTWGAACCLPWLPICKNGLDGGKGYGGRQAKPLGSQQPAWKLQQPSEVSSLPTDCGLDWLQGRTDINWNPSLSVNPVARAE